AAVQRRPGRGGHGGRLRVGGLAQGSALELRCLRPRDGCRHLLPPGQSRLLGGARHRRELPRQPSARPRDTAGSPLYPARGAPRSLLPIRRRHVDLRPGIPLVDIDRRSTNAISVLEHSFYL
uniref:Uncharacterized protein n=1 Tax=Aegilops tauschii subsp. strangulata TaxID=200361 RepID=A0A453NFN4_AEGTS